jgi:hypothetical protein
MRTVSNSIKEQGLMNTIPSYHEDLIKGPGEKAKDH